MKNLLKISILFALLIGCLPNVNAQRDISRLSFGMTGSIYQPKGALERNGFKTGVGFGVDAMYNLTNTNIANQPIAIHIGAGIMSARTIGRQTTILLDDSFDEEATSSIYNSFVDLSLKGRAVFFPTFFVSPYLEGAVGGRFLGTRNKITLIEDDPYYEDVTNNLLEGSNTLFTSVGGGFLIRLRECVDFDLGMSYSSGTSAEYGDLNTFVVEDYGPRVDYKKSITEQLGFHFGARFYLGCGYRSYNRPSRNRGPRIRKTPRIKKRKLKVRTRPNIRN